MAPSTYLLPLGHIHATTRCQLSPHLVSFSLPSPYRDICHACHHRTTSAVFGDSCQRTVQRILRFWYFLNGFGAFYIGGNLCADMSGGEHLNHARKRCIAGALVLVVSRTFCLSCTSLSAHSIFVTRGLRGGWASL